MKEDWSSANHLRNFPRQKKALCVWSKMQILHFYFVLQTLHHVFDLQRADISSVSAQLRDNLCSSFVKFSMYSKLSSSLSGSWEWISFSLLLIQRLTVKLFDLICCKWQWSLSSFRLPFTLICFNLFYYFHRPQGQHRLLNPGLSILFKSGPFRTFRSVSPHEASM